MERTMPRKQKRPMSPIQTIQTSLRGVVPLSLLREAARLTRKHWGNGSLRSLLIGEGGYRPNLYVKPEERETTRRLNQGWSLEEIRVFAADCEERKRLADLYDTIQEARGDNRRAART
jgi:hypothetical protein